jgi:protein-disulfide isomerase
MPPLSERDHVLGAPDTPTTLVEYGDYECPYCAKAYLIVESILRQTGDRLLFAFRHFPLREHFRSGVRSGVNGTPRFFINGRRCEGPWDEASLLGALQGPRTRRHGDRHRGPL